MIVTERQVGPADLHRPALTLDCVLCGARAAVLLPGRPADTGVDHRCGTDLTGPTWTLTQRPARSAASLAQADRIRAALAAGHTVPAPAPAPALRGAAA